MLRGEPVRSKAWTVGVLALFLISGYVHAQPRIIDLNLESALDIAMENSYQVQQLRLGIERTRHNLKAQQAGLKSRVYMNLRAPQVNYTSDSRWNSFLQKDEIIRQNTRRFQMDLSIRQPVILFGYPTNGYLSLNNQLYQYIQKRDDNENVDYYNRYFIQFSQPLFQPNDLKNSLEQAELSLESEELGFISDIARMMDGIADDYYRLLELAFEDEIYSRHVDNLERINGLARMFAAEDSTRALDSMQLQVELANTSERLSQNQLDMRFRIADMKQELILDTTDSLFVVPRMKDIAAFDIDVDQAIQFGYQLQPRMRTLEISRRRSEISHENTKARGAFSMDLSVTYGLEKKDEYYDNLWEEQDNSYSVSVNAYVPIWDWGERKERILASEIGLERTDLNIEQTRTRIASDITNAIENLQEYQRRAISMRDNVDVSRDLLEQSIAQYEMGNLSINDLIRIVTSHRDSELNLVDAYLGWRESLLRLTMNTYYDYEKGQPLLDTILEHEEDVAQSPLEVSLISGN